MPASIHRYQDAAPTGSGTLTTMNPVKQRGLSPNDGCQMEEERVCVLPHPTDGAMLKVQRLTFPWPAPSPANALTGMVERTWMSALNAGTSPYNTVPELPPAPRRVSFPPLWPPLYNRAGLLGTGLCVSALSREDTPSETSWPGPAHGSLYTVHMPSQSTDFIFTSNQTGALLPHNSHDCGIQGAASWVEGAEGRAIGDVGELGDAGRHEVGEDEWQTHVEQKHVHVVQVQGRE